MEALAAQVINFLAASLSACGLMIIWFDTSFFVDYLKLFKLTKFTYIEEYEKELFENPELSFLEFVFIKEPNFLNKMLVCPYCLGFWISTFCCLLVARNIFLIFACYALTLFFYFIFKKWQYSFS